jgi:rfaE bifunctional protein nucleotidyltransferase chain/domain
MIRVLANGCFDCLHIGHVAHLQAARNLGNELIVALTDDAYVNKGPGRPVFTWEERRNMLMALACVNNVIKVRDSLDGIGLVCPDIFVKGAEYKEFLPEQEIIEFLGVKVVFLDTQPVYSSTHILNGKLLEDRIRTARERV